MNVTVKFALIKNWADDDAITAEPEGKKQD